jgi:hypothetical protein
MCGVLRNHMVGGTTEKNGNCIKEGVRVMKMKRTSWLILGLMGCLFFGNAFAQTGGDIQLQIRLRHNDGTAVIEETVILQRFPEEESKSRDCTTDVNGICTWFVRRGLYQLLFERPLDDISALALAEGGLRGFGITVGDESITYHFTFHSDGRVYFDAAPEAAVPSPIIPVGDLLHGGTLSTATPSPPPHPAEGVTVSVIPSAEQVAVENTAVNNAPSNPWRFILLISGGLIIGGGIHLMVTTTQAGLQS